MKIGQKLSIGNKTAENGLKNGLKTRSIGASFFACLHIAQAERARASSRNSAQGGIGDAPTGASPRNPQLAHFQLAGNFNPLQTLRLLEAGPLKLPKICLIVKFLSLDFDRTHRLLPPAKIDRGVPPLDPAAESVPTTAYTRRSFLPTPPSEGVPTPNLSLSTSFLQPQRRAIFASKLV